MLLRLSMLILFASIFPTIAFAPSLPQRSNISLQEHIILRLAEKEMPLPVLRVTTLVSAEGKRRFVIEMSTAALPWAKKPVCHVMFQANDENGKELEQALLEASAFARAFIELAKSNPALQTERWY